MSETKAAFAERTTWSLKNIFYRCMEDYGYKYIQKLPQFATVLNSIKKVSTDLKTKDFKNPSFCPFCRAND